MVRKARAEKKLAATSKDEGAAGGSGPGARGAGGASGAGSQESWEDHKTRHNRAAQLPKLRDKVLADIEAAETRKAEIAAIYADAGFFQRASRNEIDALVKEQEALGPRIDALVGEWEAIEREMEQA